MTMWNDNRWLGLIAILVLAPLTHAIAAADGANPSRLSKAPENSLAELRITGRCRGYAQCRYVGEDIFLDFEIFNTLEVPIGFPAEYIRKQGPAILLSAPAMAGATAREVRLRTNLADWKLRDRWVTLAPGRSVSLPWVIHASEFEQLAPKSGTDVFAHFEVYTEIEVAGVKRFARARQVIRFPRP